MTLNAGNTAIGSFKALPPTLLLQYPLHGLPVKPYVAPVSRRILLECQPAGRGSMDNSSSGGALQVGVDIPLT